MTNDVCWYGVSLRARRLGQKMNDSRQMGQPAEARPLPGEHPPSRAVLDALVQNTPARHRATADAARGESNLIKADKAQSTQIT